MRVLVAGDWHSDLHEAEVCKSLRRLGHEALEFKWFQYFSYDTGRRRTLDAVLKRLQNKFVTGPLIARINRDFLTQVCLRKPDVIFVYRGTHLTAATLRKISRELPACKLVGYNNDDPFSPTQPRYLWRNFMDCIPVYDLMLAYRHSNLKDYMLAGARKAELLRSWFVPDRNYPVAKNHVEIDKYATDVVFVGHYEDDQRLSCLEAIAERGFCLKIYGPGYEWNPVLENSNHLNKQMPIRLIWGTEYNNVISGAKIALCFLSKLNRDTYTRRCFEIPACKTLLMSEYTDDLASIFREDEEAIFFRNSSELVEKISCLLKNQELIEKISEAGYRRVIEDGHDIDSRMTRLIHSIKQLKG